MTGRRGGLIPFGRQRQRIEAIQVQFQCIPIEACTSSRLVYNGSDIKQVSFSLSYQLADFLGSWLSARLLWSEDIETDLCRQLALALGYLDKLLLAIPIR